MQQQLFYDKYKKYKTKYVSLKNEIHTQHGGLSKMQNDKYKICYPWASNFLEWLIPNLRKAKIPYKNPNTGGDFSRTFIGENPDEIMLDWKHLDISDIDYFNEKINKFGYNIYRQETTDGFIVQFKTLTK